MARAIKKVKGSTKHSKKFWAILWSIIGGVVLIATALTITLILVLDDKESEYPFFESITEECDISYNSFDRVIDSSSVDHIFAFVYDGSWDPEDSTSDAEYQDRVIELYNEVVKYNENYEDDFLFYLIDTRKSRNSQILTEEKFGAVTNPNSLLYFYGGEYTKYGFDDEDGYKDSITGSGQNIVKQAITFVKEVAALNN